jgi:hypothetical protein
MRIITFIEFPHIIKQILEHLELWLTHNHDPSPPRIESSTCITYDDAFSYISPIEISLHINKKKYFNKSWVFIVAIRNKFL